MPLGGLGRALIVTGIVLVVVGLFFIAAARLPRVPGDIVIQRPNVTIYFPIGTMILVSVLLTLVLNFALRR
jgi:ABC-type transporter Mla subunit MlaD